MIRRLLLLVTIISLPQKAHGQANNFCMDCIQRQVQREEPNRVWFESDGFCCNLPCAGYESYELKEADRGSGCLTREVKNELVEGDICASNDSDLGCPEPPPSPPPDKGTNWGTVINPGSPIVIDLGKESYRLTSAADGVMFDLRNEGRAIRTAWTRAGIENAFLAWDRNGNGRIDSGAELFGNFTPLRSGAIARNGYDALGELDGNQDGVVDAGDVAWTVLLLWTDRNHDGLSTADELQRISDSAIAELETTPAPVGRKDQWGNEFRYMAHARIRHPHAESSRVFYDVFFQIAP